MRWGEAYRLTVVLANDPGSFVCAALAGWTHPVSREWIVLADHRDSTEFGRAGRKAKRYPRPWTTDRSTQHFGGSRMTSTELRRVLDHHRREETPDG